MSELLPTVQAREIHRGLVDYLRTTFALADPDAGAALADFLEDPENGIFKGPYLRLRLPFKPAADGWRDALSWHSGFAPYGHQAEAFRRLSSLGLGVDRPRPLPTLITTGTGSGKTEAFLYPILDHVLRARAASVPGVKALILYPMNALANDQAKRLTELLTTRPELVGVAAALYTGEKGNRRTTVTQEGLITDREIIRDSAPDILLTNYKMLDQLLLRAEDQTLWRQSSTSLQYIVLDEFHTYDGAQGTDVAMLLRRLGWALKSYWPEGAFTADDWARPLGRVTPVATSATLGDQNDSTAMIDFAAEVFGDDFGADSVVSEDRLTFDEWADGAVGRASELGLVPKSLARSELASLNNELRTAIAEPAVLAATIMAALYDATVATVQSIVAEDESVLLELVRAHPLTLELVAATERAVGLDQVAAELFPDPSPLGDDDTDRVEFLMHLVAALSHIRARLGRSALTVDLHLWVRELTRIDRVASASAEFVWGDDGSQAVSDDPYGGVLRPLFPAIYCRHCGRSGWGVELAATGTTLTPEDGAIRRRHAMKEGRFRALLYAPLEDAHEGPADDPVEGLRWFSVKQRELLAGRPDDDDRDVREGWVLPVLTQVGHNADVDSKADTCPSCQQRDAIRFLGSAIATLLSVGLSTLFGAESLDPAEKKALVFTDSVQDAAHRAGFVESRSHVLTFRAVLRAAVADRPKSLDAVVDEAIRQAADDPFRRFRLLPPELTGRTQFADFWRKPIDAVPAVVLKRVQSRLLFDAELEVGLQSRYGRTLEQTGSVVVDVAVSRERLEEVARAVLQAAEVQDTLQQSQAGDDSARLVGWVRGVLEHIRERGGINHPWLDRYVAEDGNRYWIWGGRRRLGTAQKGMPAFPTGRSAPAFPRIGTVANPGREQLLDPVTAPQSWYARWAAAALEIGPAHGAKLARLLLERLAHEGVLRALPTSAGAVVYALSPDSVMVHPTTVDSLRSGGNLLVCSVCRAQTPCTSEVSTQLVGFPCLLVRCPGHLERTARDANYYRTLYASADMRRIVAREHSGILEEETRLLYEEGFKAGRAEPDAPNVLVATPTLEMGIDIGDLSAVLLASLPRTVASYLQRVGRAGRATGNALNVAFVTGRGTNLQRLGDPGGLINGQVRPPATYLSATEILRRQYLAHLVDCFARDESRPHPRRATKAMDATPQGFLGQLVAFAESEAKSLLSHFLAGFTGLSDAATGDLRSWATPSSGAGSSALAAMVFEAAKLWADALEGLIRRQKEIHKELPALEHASKLPGAGDDDKRAFRSARAGLQVTNAELTHLRGGYWISVLEEYGLLPNYTLIDDGVKLEVSLTWVDAETGAYEYESTALRRGSANALREFAPGSTFYGRGLEIEIDAVDLGVGDSAIRRMSFCAACGYARDALPVASKPASASCPRCGDPAISGVEQQLDVVELTRVSAELNRDEAQISDRVEERTAERFSIFVAADIDEAGVADEWYLDGYSFGVKYLSRLRLRWLNAGRQMGAVHQIAGVRAPAPLFRVCEGCGKLDRQAFANTRGEHRAWCPHRQSDNEHTRSIALLRTLTTQGAVLRLPTSVTLGDKYAVPSLAAAVLLGLQDQIGGLPDHLEIAQIRMPVDGDPGSTADALLLHDVVPGGTGYLAELAQPDRVWDLLHRGWRLLADHDCGVGRPACHRCLLPFASPWQAELVSRATAERHLREILTSGAPGRAPAEAVDWEITKVEPTKASSESHLEQKFRHRLIERLTGLGATVKEVSSASGNIATISLPNSPRQWTLVPQVNIGDSKPDFVLRSTQSTLPEVAIFTDGWTYHASRTHNAIAEDCEKRRNLRDSGRIVVGVSWRDLDEAEEFAPAEPSWFSLPALQMQMQQGAAFGPDHIDVIRRGPIAFLLDWIQRPDLEGYRSLADRLPWLFALTGTQFALDPNQSLGEVAVERIADSEPLTSPERARTNAWWWQQGALGCLTRASSRGGQVTLETALILDDRVESLDERHRVAWEEWLRLSNVLGLREQPLHVLAVTMGEATPTALDESSEPGRFAVLLPDGWQELVSLATDAERAVLIELANLGTLPVPEVGYETDGGLPIDLAWPSKQIAVLLDPDDLSIRDLRVSGWTIVAPDPAAISAAVNASPETRN